MQRSKGRLSSFPGGGIHYFLTEALLGLGCVFRSISMYKTVDKRDVQEHLSHAYFWSELHLRYFWAEVNQSAAELICSGPKTPTVSLCSHLSKWPAPEFVEPKHFLTSMNAEFESLVQMGIRCNNEVQMCILCARLSRNGTKLQHSSLVKGITPVVLNLVRGIEPFIIEK